MELSKAVCKRCRLYHNEWWDDHAWRDAERIVCPPRLSPEQRHCNNIHKPPPDFCPYFLEHLLVNGFSKFKFKNYLLVRIHRGDEHGHRHCLMGGTMEGRWCGNQFLFRDGFFTGDIHNFDVMEI